MTVLNELDRFHLVMDAIDPLPQEGNKGIYLKQQLKDKLVEHKQYIDKYGQDLPEIRNWKWQAADASSPAKLCRRRTSRAGIRASAPFPCLLRIRLLASLYRDTRKVHRLLGLAWCELPPHLRQGHLPRL